ncbi:MAG: glycosyltransferase family 2 protein [Ignavibacteriales bacterium]|nr:glycosyltransferase family 2 protein [Ignavibacteriales bacterium]
MNKRIVVIIPAFNEEESLPRVIADIPEFVDEIIVVNNGSSDKTEEVAKSLGVTVLNEHERGYGAACLKAIDYTKNKQFDIVVFLDGDYSDHPEEMNLIVEPIIKNGFDLVIGSRMLGKREKGAMLPQAVFLEIGSHHFLLDFLEL